MRSWHAYVNKRKKKGECAAKRGMATADNNSMEHQSKEGKRKRISPLRLRMRIYIRTYMYVTDVHNPHYERWWWRVTGGVDRMWWKGMLEEERTEKLKISGVKLCTYFVDSKSTFSGLNFESLNLCFYVIHNKKMMCPLPFREGCIFWIRSYMRVDIYTSWILLLNLVCFMTVSTMWVVYYEYSLVPFYKANICFDQTLSPSLLVITEIPGSSSSCIYILDQNPHIMF